MTPQRDFQRSKVYAWENELFGPWAEELPLGYCKDLAAELYGRRVIVKDGRGRRRACAFVDCRAKIALPKWARNRVVICHEVAHLITARIDDDLPAHGAVFMQQYIRLLDYQQKANYAWLVDHAREYGLKVAG